MIKLNKLKRTNCVFFILMFILSTLLLGACTNKEQPKHKIPAKNEKPKAPVAALGNEWKLPISIPKSEGEFSRLAGWLSDTELLYITNLEQTSSVFRYNLLSGKSELLYRCGSPIVTVQISPTRKFLLIHSSPSSYEGLVTIIDSKGTELSKESFASYELVFEWNPYNESEVLVSKFDEDWNFQLFLLDINNAKTTEIYLPQPFVKWMDESEAAFLNWDESNPSLYAPLVVKGLDNGMEKTVLPSAIQFSAFRGLLMAVTVNEQDKKMADYSFFDHEIKKLFTFSIPQLTKFSDWLVPFYDYNVQMGQFITFSPLKSGEADSYSEGFQLLTFDLKKGSSKLIMEGLQNEPINFSPTGKAILYGNQFEKMIDINAKKIYDAIKE
ncbi:hypothetical protein [Bacillus salipaludis]|uniref:YqgU-like 6-bladed beta-propeller domain-containing protein n=1 Tax=Bacillus salipaludis TaxID=2547811 RepID=A0ABW8RLH3_9BACI